MTTIPDPDGEGSGPIGGVDPGVGNSTSLRLGNIGRGAHVQIGRVSPLQVPVTRTPKSKQFTLYHGSPNANLKPGDIIEPRSPLAQSRSVKEVKVANATTNRAVANAFSKESGAIYKVKPVSRLETAKTTFKQRGSSPWKGQVVSTKGFKVVGVSTKTAPDFVGTDLTMLMRKKK